MYRPPQCTEREPDGTWEDCTFASGVMLGNAAHAAAVYPSTQAEYERLRRLSGRAMTGGTNLADLEKGMRLGWGWTATRTTVHTSFASLWSQLSPGIGAVVQGSMGGFPVGHHLRRWDPRFGGPHAVYVQREDAGDRVWWMNPEAPASYAGEWITKAQLAAYWNAFGGTIMRIKIGGRAAPAPAKEEAVLTFAVPTEPSVGHIARNVVLYTTDALDPKDPKRIIIDPARDMPYLGDPKPGVRLVEYVNAKGVHTGHAYFVPAASVANIRPATPTGGKTQADIDLAVAAAVKAEQLRAGEIVGAAQHQIVGG